MPEILPRIGYSDVIGGATLTTTPALYIDTSSPANVQDWRSWSFWRPSGGTTRTIEADLGGSKTVSAAAIYGHDASGSVTVDRWDGAAWVPVASATAAGDGAVLWLSWASIATTKLRFTFASLSYLAILWAGPELILPTGIPGGWSDPVLAQRPMLFPETSRKGVHLGTAIEMWDAKLTLGLKNLEAEWVRDYWMPFVRTCAARPFFLHWNKDEWSGSACLCTSPEFGSSEFTQRGLIDVSVAFVADTGYDQRAAP